MRASTASSTSRSTKIFRGSPHSDRACPRIRLFAIEGALAKDPAYRWQSAEEFLEHLTYNPPPVLPQSYPAGATPADDEPTVRFRRRNASGTLTSSGSVALDTIPPADGPSPRCRVASMADQRACLLAYIAVNDAPLQRVYDSLIVELRRVAGVRPRQPHPPTVERLRV